MIYRLQAANVLPTGLLTNACLDVRRVVKRSQNYVPTELNLPTVRNSSRSNSKEIDALVAGSDVDLVPVTQRLRAAVPNLDFCFCLQRRKQAFFYRSWMSQSVSQSLCHSSSLFWEHLLKAYTDKRKKCDIIRVFGSTTAFPMTRTMRISFALQYI